MNEYELLYIVTPRKAPAEVELVVNWVGEQVAVAGGEVLSANNWGRRRLAYPINHHFEGTYILTRLRLPAAGAVVFESALHITEDVIRHLLIRGIMGDESAPPEYVGERPRSAPRPVAPAFEPREAVASAPHAEPEAEAEAVSSNGADASDAEEAEAPAEPAEEPAPVE